MWFKAGGIPPAGSNPPVTIVNRRTAATPAGYFTPLAEVAFAGALGTSGLLKVLSASDLQTLIALLCLVTDNGRVSAAASQVAAVLGIPTPSAHVRLTRLCRLTWRGRAVAMRIGGDPLPAFVVSPEIVGQRLGPLETGESPGRFGSGPAGRDAIVSASRVRHAARRSDVETGISQRNGWLLPEEVEANEIASRATYPALTGDDLHARERLVKLGVDHQAADSLVRRFGRERVGRQIAYLPYRNAKDQTKLLVSSIESDYEAPTSFR